MSELCLWDGSYGKNGEESWWSAHCCPESSQYERRKSDGDSGAMLQAHSQTQAGMRGMLMKHQTASKSQWDQEKKTSHSSKVAQVKEEQMMQYMWKDAFFICSSQENCFLRRFLLLNTADNIARSQEKKLLEEYMETNTMEYGSTGEFMKTCITISFLG